MPGLKELKSRITSVNSTIQITSAMKLVSASKLKRAQNEIENFRPYIKELKDTLELLNISIENSDFENKYSKSNISNKILFVAISSNKGLCGGFNVNVSKYIQNEIKKNYSDKNVDVFCIGKKAKDSLKRMKINVIGIDEIILNKYKSDEIEKITSFFVEKYLKGEYEKIILVFNTFKNAVVQIITEEQLLPFENKTENLKINNENFIFEPEETLLIEKLTPMILRAKIREAILNSIASEHGARMTSMHKATDNGKELKRALTLQFNKSRQAAITNEINEIVAGVNAMS